MRGIAYNIFEQFVKSEDTSLYSFSDPLTVTGRVTQGPIIMLLSINNIFNDSEQ